MGAGLSIGFVLALALSGAARDEQSLYLGSPGGTVVIGRSHL